MMGMKKFIAYGAAFASLWSGASSLLEAQQEQQLEPWNSLSLSGGWRYDCLHSKIGSRTDSNSTVDPVVSSSERIKLKNLSTWQIGGQLHWSIPNFCTCNDYWWLNQFYVRGYAYRGWVTNGHISNRASDSDVGVLDHNRGKIHKGRTVDGLVGVGFLYPMCGNWAVGPVGGWSYEQVHVSSKSRGGSSSSSFSDSSSSSSSSSSFGLNESRSFTSTFRGPWVGVDFAYVMSDCCCNWKVRLEAGYEYHWATWRGTNRFRSHDSNLFGPTSDRRHSNDAWGQVGYVTGWWNLCDCWELGLGFKYQAWEARRGRFRRGGSSSSGETTSSSSSSSEELRHRKFHWDSFAVNVDLGYSF